MTAVLRCAGCHRRLKRPSPSGFGPTCARKLARKPQDARTGHGGPRLPPGLSQRLRSAPVNPQPEQTALPIEETQ